MNKALVGIAFFLTSSFAAPVWADEFYIVRDLATQKCTVVIRTDRYQNDNIGH